MTKQQIQEKQQSFISMFCIKKEDNIRKIEQSSWDVKLKFKTWLTLTQASITDFYCVCNFFPMSFWHQSILAWGLIYVCADSLAAVKMSVNTNIQSDTFNLRVTLVLFVNSGTFTGSKSGNKECTRVFSKIFFHESTTFVCKTFTTSHF